MNDLIAVVNPILNLALIVLALLAWIQYKRQADASENQLRLNQKEFYLRNQPFVKTQEMTATLASGHSEAGKKFLAIGMVNMSQYPILINRVLVKGKDIYSSRDNLSLDSSDYPRRWGEAILPSETVVIADALASALERTLSFAGYTERLNEPFDIEVHFLMLSIEYKHKIQISLHNGTFLCVGPSTTERSEVDADSRNELPRSLISQEMPVKQSTNKIHKVK